MTPLGGGWTSAAGRRVAPDIFVGMLPSIARIMGRGNPTPFERPVALLATRPGTRARGHPADTRRDHR